MIYKCKENNKINGNLALKVNNSTSGCIPFEFRISFRCLNLGIFWKS